MRPSDLDPNGHDLKVLQVADVLQVTKTSIYRYLEQGDVFPNAYTLRTDWRIPQADVIAFRERGRVEGPRG